MKSTRSRIFWAVAIPASGSMPRVGGPNRRDQRVPQAPVVPIHAVGDVAVFAAAVLQQLAGAPRQQVVGRQQQHEARVFPRVGQAVEPEALEGGGAFAEPVEPELDVVRDQHPFHPARVRGVFPRLLHRALVPPRHDRVEVARAGPLQLERRHDLRGGPAEPAEGEIDAPPQDRLLRRDGVVRSLRRPAIAEHALDDLRRELPVQRGLLETMDAPRGDQLGPRLQRGEMIGGERGGPDMPFERLLVEQVHGTTATPCPQRGPRPRVNDSILTVFLSICAVHGLCMRCASKDPP